MPANTQLLAPGSRLPASSQLSASSSLPADILEQASRRLGIMCLVIAGLWIAMAPSEAGRIVFAALLWLTLIIGFIGFGMHLRGLDRQMGVQAALVGRQYVNVDEFGEPSDLTRKTDIYFAVEG